MTFQVTKKKREKSAEEVALAERLRSLYTARGFRDAKSFCEAAGVHESSVSRLASGKRGVAVSSLVKMARALGITVDEMLSGQADEAGIKVMAHADTSSREILAAVELVKAHIEASMQLRGDRQNGPDKDGN